MFLACHDANLDLLIIVVLLSIVTSTGSNNIPNPLGILKGYERKPTNCENKMRLDGRTTPQS